jgi:hypothetical protein
LYAQHPIKPSQLVRHPSSLLAVAHRPARQQSYQERVEGSREAVKPPKIKTSKPQVEARNSEVHNENIALTRSLQNVEQ